MSLTTRIDENGNLVADKYWKKTSAEPVADYSIPFDTDSVNNLLAWKGEEKSLEGSYSRILDTFTTQWQDLASFGGLISKGSDRRLPIETMMKRDNFNDAIMYKVEEEGLDPRQYTFANNDDIVDPDELIRHNEEVKERRLSLDEKFQITKEVNEEWKDYEERAVEGRKAYHLGKTSRRTLGEYAFGTILAHVLSPVEWGLTYTGIKGFSAAATVGGKALSKLGLGTRHVIKNPVIRKALISTGKETGGLASAEVGIQAILREAAEDRGEEYTFSDQAFGVLAAGFLGGAAIGLGRAWKTYRSNVTVAELANDLSSGGKAVGKVAKKMTAKSVNKTDLKEATITKVLSEDMEDVGKALRSFPGQKEKVKDIFTSDGIEYFTAAQHEKVFQSSGITPTVDFYTHSTKKLSELVDDAAKNLPPSARDKVLVSQLVENKETLNQTVKLVKESKMSSGIKNAASFVDDSKEMDVLLKQLDEPNLPGFQEAIVIKEINDKLIDGTALKHGLKVINTKSNQKIHSGANHVITAVANATDSFESELAGKIKGYVGMLDKNFSYSDIKLNSKEGKNIVIASLTGDTKNLKPKVGKLSLGLKEMFVYTHDKMVKLGHQIDPSLRNNYFPSVMTVKKLRDIGEAKFIALWKKTRNIEATARKMDVSIQGVIPSVKRSYKELISETKVLSPDDATVLTDLQERLWVFKDAASQAEWLALTGPDTLKEVIEGYVKSKSRAMSVKYYFGNDVKRTWKLYNKLGTPDFVKNNPNSLESRQWKYLNDVYYREQIGTLRGTPNEVVHVVTKSLNSASIIKHLVDVAVASTGDVPIMMFTIQSAFKNWRLSVKTASRAVKNIFAINKQEVDYLASQGLAVIDLAGSVSDRFMNPITGELGKVTRNSLNFGMLKKVVEAMRASLDITVSGQLGRQLSKNWSDLTSQNRHMFKLMNISESDFIKVKKMGAVLSRNLGDSDKLLDLQKIKSLDIDLGVKFDHYIREVRNTGSPLLSSSGRSLLTGGYKSGSAPRGLRDVFSLYMNFMLGVLESMNRMIRYSGSPEEAVKIMVPFAVTATAFTGMTMQLRELAKGRTPRPMTNKKFMVEAMVRTGVVGPIVEKIAMAELYNNSVASNFIPPGIDVALELAGGVGRAVSEGKTDKLTKSSLELIPYRNFYNRLILKKLLHDPIRRTLSPKEFKEYEKFEKSMLNKRGQSKFW